MKKLLILPALMFLNQAVGQAGWKQSVRYELMVQFHPAEKSLDVLMKMGYTNHSHDTLHFIWLHIWPNAYRNDRNAYSDQLLENGDLCFYFSSKEQKGYLNRLDFRVNGIIVLAERHPKYPDVIKLILPKPLLPGDSLQLSSSFHLRLPYNFNGNGYSAHHFEFRNWYPEPAVYDQAGWHPIPLLSQGGAYHETADFRVQIESPALFRIATGSEADSLPANGNNVRYLFELHHANSFAWIADSRYHQQNDSVQPHSGKKIRIQYFYFSAKGSGSEQVIPELKKQLTLLSEWLGPFPYQTITIARASSMYDQDFSGLICLDPMPTSGWQLQLRKQLIAQWFQTAIATDQRSFPWLSKGLTNYYEKRLADYLPTQKTGAEKNLLWLRVAEAEKTTQPLSTPAADFSLENDSLIASVKSGLWFQNLSAVIGTAQFDSSVQSFIRYWQFNHPYPADFKYFTKNHAKSTDSFYHFLNDTRSLFPAGIKRKLKPVFLFSARNTSQYNYIGISPIPGYNLYDGFMLGALIHNINLPANPFEFVLAPVYAFGSKSFEGLGRLSYSWKPAQRFRSVTLGLNGERFDTNKGIDTAGNALFENVVKITPYIRVELNPPNARSTIRQWINFKSFLITEKTFKQFSISAADSLIHPNNTSSTFRYVNQLSYHFMDSRSLYPYDIAADLQQSELFYRINLNLNYFLNYPDGGGLQFRFFASKFGVWNSKNFSQVTRYEPKLLGVNGYEDYLYQSYYVGRSASDATENTTVPNSGIAARQIMNRDGGLKLRTDAYDFLQGRSENWVTSVNFETTLPAKLLPLAIPIKLFFDIGTYSEAWGNNSPTGRFLYAGGIQLSLFRNVLNIYAPVLYSNDFNEALSSASFVKKITFSIDFQNINYRKLIRKLAEIE